MWDRELLKDGVTLSAIPYYRMSTTGIDPERLRRVNRSTITCSYLATRLAERGKAVVLGTSVQAGWCGLVGEREVGHTYGFRFQSGLVIQELRDGVTARDALNRLTAVMGEEYTVAEQAIEFVVDLQISAMGETASILYLAVSQSGNTAVMYFVARGASDRIVAAAPHLWSVYERQMRHSPAEPAEQVPAEIIAKAAQQRPVAEEMVPAHIRDQAVQQRSGPAGRVVPPEISAKTGLQPSGGEELGKAVEAVLGVGLGAAAILGYGVVKGVDAAIAWITTPSSKDRG